MPHIAPYTPCARHGAPCAAAACGVRGPSRGSEGGAETQRVRSFPLHKTDTSAMALKFVVSFKFFFNFFFLKCVFVLDIKVDKADTISGSHSGDVML